MRMTVPEMEWLPYYFVKKDKRAKQVKLRPSKKHGLIVTVPPRFNFKELAPLLIQHRLWIEENTASYFAIKTLPNHLIFHAKNETWQVNYMKSHTKPVIYVRPQCELIVLGHHDDQSVCFSKLTHWIKKYAKGFLEEELLKVSAETKLKFSKLIIRNQQTLWGSCSHDHAISLNYKLIFLPPSLMRHVMLHELCHTVHMDHSLSFWNLVASFDSAWREKKKALKDADQYVPTWII